RTPERLGLSGDGFHETAQAQSHGGAVTRDTAGVRRARRFPPRAGTGSPNLYAVRCTWKFRRWTLAIYSGSPSSAHPEVRPCPASSSGRKGTGRRIIEILVGGCVWSNTL